MLKYLRVVTPHEQRERGKVIGVGVHIYICVCGPNLFFESYFSDRLTYLNIHRTSRQIYRNVFLVELFIDFLLMYTISFLSEDDVIMVSSLNDQ